MVSVDDFTEVKDCIYKDEHYSVRDNGAVMRHPKEGKKPRRNDNQWSFGKKNAKTGYMDFSGERVHRIVAFAYLGTPPTDQHIVDHIDTNRCNNRPDNLRWVTKLENALNNPITRARIELICGSIEAFIENPSMLYSHEKMDNNVLWMRTVTPDEARISYDRLLKWAKERPKPQDGNLGEWLFRDAHSNEKRIINEKPVAKFVSHSWEHNVELESKEEEEEDYYSVTESLTPNAQQLNWQTPSEFPYCPPEISDHPLEDYKANLIPGTDFCKNKYYSSHVVESAMCNGGKSLYVMTQNSDENYIKPWALSQIFFEDGIFYHSSKGTFFHEDGVKKYFTLAQGKEWTGGEVFDDLC